MPTKTSSSYKEMLQSLAERYLQETGQQSATATAIAVWAINKGLWTPPRNFIIRKCREDISKALREEYILDEHGRSVRAKHVARICKEGEQMYLWADIRTAPRAHMEVAFRQRRMQIVGECRQLKRDIDYYNAHHPDNAPIQMVFDFRDDVEEGNVVVEFTPRKPR